MQMMFLVMIFYFSVPSVILENESGHDEPVLTRAAREGLFDRNDTPRRHPEWRCCRGALKRMMWQ